MLKASRIYHWLSSLLHFLGKELWKKREWHSLKQLPAKCIAGFFHLEENVCKRLPDVFQLRLKRLPRGTFLGGILSIIVIFSLSARHFSWSGESILPDLRSRKSIAATDTLTFSFPVVMNKQSVERHLRWADGIEGETSWQGDTLIIKPNEQLVYATDYLFTLTADAETADNKPLGEDLHYLFTVDQAPKLVFFAPEKDAKSVHPRQRVTVSFDRAMVSMDTLLVNARSESGSFPTITPSVAGQWKWITTTTAEFVPKDGFALATAYTVQVPKGTKTMSGEETPEESAWHFETERPAFRYSRPSKDEKGIRSDTAITITFSQPIDLESVHKNVQVTTAGDANNLLDVGKIAYQKWGGESSSVDTKTILLPLEKPLELYGNYVIRIAPGIKSMSGTLASEKGEEIPFSTIGDFTVHKVVFQEYEQGFQVSLSSPVDLSLAKEHLSLTLEDGSPVPFTLGKNVTSSFSVSFAGRRNTRYRFTCKKSLEDIYHRSLGKDHSVEHFIPPYEPNLRIDNNGQYTILAPGEKPRADIVATNVPQLETALASMNIENFILWKSRYHTWQNRKGNRPDTSVNASKHRSFSLKTGIPPDQQYKQSILPLPSFADSQQLGHGIYIYTFSSPNILRWGDSQEEIFTRIFNVTDLAIAAKTSSHQALVSVTDRRSGMAIANAHVKIHNEAGALLANGNTDKDGALLLNIPEIRSGDDQYSGSIWISAETDDDIVAVSQYFHQSRPASDVRSVLIMNLRTDRPVYRPGETVAFSGFVRKRNADDSLEIPGQTRFEAQFRSSNHTEALATKTLSINSFGGVHGEFILPENAELGLYTIAITSLSQDQEVQGGVVHFDVLEFRKPEFRISASFVEPVTIRGNSVPLDIEASYLFGSPVAGASISWSLYANRSSISLPSAAGFVFDDLRKSPDSPSEENCQYNYAGYGESSDKPGNNISSNLCHATVEGKTVLDATGRARIQIPVSTLPSDKTWNLSFSATVTSPDARILRTSVSGVAHPQNNFVGISAQPRIVTVGSPIRIDMLTSSLNASPLAGRDVLLKVLPLSRSQYLSGSGSIPEPQTLQTDLRGKASILLEQLPAGRFFIVAETTDSAGRVHRSSFPILVKDINETPLQAGVFGDDVSIALDRSEYEIGDTARAIITIPEVAQHTPIVYTLEQGSSILEHRILYPDALNLTVDVPVTKELRPNARVTVSLFLPSYGSERQPTVRSASAELLVSQSDRQLHLVLQPDRKLIGPRETFSLAIRTTTKDGSPLPAEVSLAVVDQGILELKKDAGMTDIVENFYPRKQVYVSHVHSSSFLQKPAVLWEWNPTQETGGFGGAGDDAWASAITREYMKNTAFWDPAILTDDDGNAKISITLPDNLTTWNLRAVAATVDHRFGSAEETVISTLPIIIRSVHPSFGVWGDQTTLTAVVHNQLPTAQTVTVSLTGKGFTPRGATSSTRTIEAGSSVSIAVPVTFQEASSLSWTWTAASAQHRDAVKMAIPLYPIASIETVATTGRAYPESTETFSTSPIEHLSLKKATVGIFPTLQSFMESGMQYLTTYPYGCAEQLLSSVLPYVVAKRLGWDDPAKKKENEERLKEVMERLKKLQRADGGFGFWENSDRSYPFLSAYVLRGLVILEQSNFPVEADIRKRLEDYLAGVLSTTNESELSWNERTDIMFALSLAGQRGREHLQTLFAHRSQISITSKAMLALSYPPESSEEVTILLHDIARNFKAEGRLISLEDNEHYSFSLGSPQVTQALVLQAFVYHKQEHVAIPGLLRHLLASRIDGHWQTTQATLQALLALEKVLALDKASDNAPSAIAVSINDVSIPVTSKSAKDIREIRSDLLKLKDLNQLTIDAGSGKTYYDVVLNYQLAGSTLPPIDKGFGVVRRFETLTGSQATLVFGESYKMKIIVTVPRERHLVAIEAPIPAGMELVDTSLQTASQEAVNVESKDRMHDWWGYDSIDAFITRKELRDDRLFLFADTLQPGVYEFEAMLHAVLPGTFNVRPASAFMMYYPEISGSSEAKSVVIHPKK